MTKFRIDAFWVCTRSSSKRIRAMMMTNPRKTIFHNLVRTKMASKMNQFVLSLASVPLSKSYFSVKITVSKPIGAG